MPWRAAKQSYGYCTQGWKRFLKNEDRQDKWEKPGCQSGPDVLIVALSLPQFFAAEHARDKHQPGSQQAKRSRLRSSHAASAILGCSDIRRTQSALPFPCVAVGARIAEIEFLHEMAVRTLRSVQVDD